MSSEVAIVARFWKPRQLVDNSCAYFEVKLLDSATVACFQHVASNKSPGDLRVILGRRVLGLDESCVISSGASK